MFRHDANTVTRALAAHDYAPSVKHKTTLPESISIVQIFARLYSLGHIV